VIQQSVPSPKMFHKIGGSQTKAKLIMTPKPPETLDCVPEGRARSDGPLFVE